MVLNKDGVQRAKRKKVCMTEEKDAKRMRPESRKEICRAQAAWSR